MLFLCFLLVAVFPSGILGQTEWGFKSYTKYETGNMSLIITVPHGGSEEPTKQENGDKWPKRTHGCLESNECVWKHDCGTPDNKRCRARTLLASPQTSFGVRDKRTPKDVCGEARTLSDSYSIRVARDIADGINSISGMRPHVVYNILKRSKLDTNREINQATFNVPDAIKAYHNYTNFINKALSAIPDRGLLLDIHGHGHKIQRTELGYLIYGSRLDSGYFDPTDSSIRSLGDATCGNNTACFKKLIRGKRSLGHFMNQEGLRAVPSPQEPGPMVCLTGVYFSGGFTVKEYGSRSKDEGVIDAIQMEFPQKLRKNKLCGKIQDGRWQELL